MPSWEKSALAYLYSVVLFVLIIVIVREAHFFKIILFQSLSKHRAFLSFFQIQGYTFGSKYFRGTAMVLSRAVPYTLTVIKVKMHV